MAAATFIVRLQAATIVGAPPYLTPSLVGTVQAAFSLHLTARIDWENQMNQRVLTARRVAAACAELREEAVSARLDLLAHILTLAILEARAHQALAPDST